MSRQYTTVYTKFPSDECRFRRSWQQPSGRALVSQFQPVTVVEDPTLTPSFRRTTATKYGTALAKYYQQLTSFCFKQQNVHNRITRS